MTIDSEKAVKTAARDWLLRLSLESPSVEEQAVFAAWCREDPRHATAFRRLESIWQEATSLEQLRPFADLPPARGSGWQRVRASLAVQPVRWAGTASLAVAIIAVGVWYPLAPMHYVTGVAEVREIHLSDGSDVILGARSSLDVALHLRERRVTLISGVAFFSVSKDISRPFIVRVGDKEVRVVGTKFEIRHDLTKMRVAVVAGTVEVMQVLERGRRLTRDPSRTVSFDASAAHAVSAVNPSEVPIVPPAVTTVDNQERRVLTAGQQVTAALVGAIPPPQVMPHGEPAAWRHGRLVYVDAPLKDIIADANRYSHEPIAIADEGVANVRVSVTYPCDRIEEMMATLSRSLSLEIEHPRSGGMLLKAK